MKVAWHFSARNKFQNGFVPKGRYDSMWSVCSPGAERTPVAADHTVPYGTGRLSRKFQAINCLATFIAFLRDKSSGLFAIHALQIAAKPA